MLSEEMVRRVDWDSLPAGGGRGVDVGGLLLDLLSASGPIDAQRAFDGLENVLFSQDDVYGVAEPAVDVLFAGLAGDLPLHSQIAVLDLLYHVVRGQSLDNPGLQLRVRERALRGVWLLAWLANRATPAGGAAVELLELLDSDVAGVIEES